MVDTPVPPLNVLYEIFAAVGVPTPPTTPLPWGEDQKSVLRNSNGGLYLIWAALLPDLAPVWETWARWLLDRLQPLLDGRSTLITLPGSLPWRRRGSGPNNSTSDGKPRSTI